MSILLVLGDDNKASILQKKRSLLTCFQTKPRLRLAISFWFCNILNRYTFKPSLVMCRRRTLCKHDVRKNWQAVRWSLILLFRLSQLWGLAILRGNRKAQLRQGVECELVYNLLLLRYCVVVFYDYCNLNFQCFGARGDIVRAWKLQDLMEALSQIRHTEVTEVTNKAISNKLQLLGCVCNAACDIAALNKNREIDQSVLQFVLQSRALSWATLSFWFALFSPKLD